VRVLHAPVGMLRVHARTLLAISLVAVASCPAHSAAAQPDHRPVFAYYYAWWNSDTFGATIEHPTGSADGASDDPGVLSDTIRQARAAGIDAFVVDWLGNEDRTDLALQHIMDQGFATSIMFETTHFWGVDDVVQQLKAFYQARLGNPHMATLRGKPVIFFWRASTFDNGTWDGIRGEVDPEHRALWIADGDKLGILAGSAWDGLSPYAIAWSHDPEGQLQRWGGSVHDTGKLWLPPVSPGCDDSHARATTCYQPRSVDYYQSTWNGALASGPDAVVVSTFNEWMENTQIQASAEDGDAYLAATRSNAGALNGL